MFRQSPECFLIMPHSDAAPQIKHIIHNVLTEQGVELVTAKSISYRGSIMESFANAIERAHFVIADITDINPNNIFELGVAFGLRKPVLMLSQKQTINKIPFDLGGQKIIFYDPQDTELLRNFLKNWVQDSVAQVFDYPTVTAAVAQPENSAIEVKPQPVAISTPSPALAVDVTELEPILLEIVSEKTGYPCEMLELEMDMEADLGIDSIKRVEILGALQERFPSAPQPNLEDLAELRTLAQIAAYMAQLSTPLSRPESCYPTSVT
jgi:acyl carrier protein/nucleoside 2-deoxyribosyltransferase